MPFRNMTVVSLFWVASLSMGQQSPPAVQDIIHQSAQAIHQDWEKAPGFDFCEVDHNGKNSKTYLVMMISGSTYNRLVAVNGDAVSPEVQKEEEQKLAAARNQRQQETPEQRQRRTAQYEKERRRDRQLIEELTNAMEFTLIGSETVNSHETYALDAKPRPGYVPKNTMTTVLTGMQGRLWVDQSSFRWAKVKAEVVHPVMVEGFVARVEPGTEFELEEVPVGDPSGTWLPSHFAMHARVRILGIFRKSTMQDETYFHYKANGSLSPEECQQQP